MWRPQARPPCFGASAGAATQSSASACAATANIFRGRRPLLAPETTRSPRGTQRRCCVRRHVA
eukprot:3788617-Alexandrium_andersonii.AAC.1